MTLLELLIGSAILASLAYLAIPSVHIYHLKAKRVEVRSIEREIRARFIEAQAAEGFLPTNGNGNPAMPKLLCTDTATGSCWDLGFLNRDKSLRYRYHVAAVNSAQGPAFMIRAVSKKDYAPWAFHFENTAFATMIATLNDVIRVSGSGKHCVEVDAAAILSKTTPAYHDCGGTFVKVPDDLFAF